MRFNDERWWVRVALLVAAAVVALIAVSLIASPSPGEADDGEVRREKPAPKRPRGAPQRKRSRAALPEGRAITGLDAKRCHRLLRDHRVAFSLVDAADADGVEQPIRLEGPIGGMTFYHRNHGNRRRRKRIERLEILDCRVAVALLAWAPTLSAARVTKVDHYSIYRPGARVAGSGRISGHSTGMAIDVGEIWLEDGSRIDVEGGWSDKRRGEPPCPVRAGDPPPLELLRNVVCAAAEQDLFQVVLTPHHDEAHSNHVHLELRPGVDWSLLE